MTLEPLAGFQDLKIIGKRIAVLIILGLSGRVLAYFTDINRSVLSEFFLSLSYKCSNSCVRGKQQ